MGLPADEVPSLLGWVGTACAYRHGGLALDEDIGGAIDGARLRAASTGSFTAARSVERMSRLGR